MKNVSKIMFKIIKKIFKSILVIWIFFLNFGKYAYLDYWKWKIYKDNINKKVD